MTTCDYCKRPAIYHDTRVSNGITKTVSLCEDHAKEAGIDIGPDGISISLTPEMMGFTFTPSISTCPDCGMALADYKEKALLGCPECYVTFKEQLIPVIANLQEKHTQHVGRSPRRASADIDRHIAIRRLLSDLERAVTQEAYEEAADIRDTLRDLHQKDDDSAL
ncbi:MAG: UvrB/UvrC motif-containing protein [Planctomycetes bacterium]|nr:UvrB/UvrC motif-containing protein [Planctomycetota bacterium]